MAPSLFADLATQLLARGVTVRFRAAGRSMLPTVRDGDCLIVAPVSAREIAVGDVVLCEGRRGPVAHRVAAIETDAGTARFVLRGDASFEDDAPIDEAQLRGRVVAVERGGRRLPVGARPPAGLLRLRALLRRAGAAVRGALAPSLTAPTH
jgi:signal peptidase I